MINFSQQCENVQPVDSKPTIPADCSSKAVVLFAKSSLQGISVIRCKIPGVHSNLSYEMC